MRFERVVIAADRNVGAGQLRSLLITHTTCNDIEVLEGPSREALDLLKDRADDADTLIVRLAWRDTVRRTIQRLSNSSNRRPVPRYVDPERLGEMARELKGETETIDQQVNPTPAARLLYVDTDDLIAAPTSVLREVSNSLEIKSPEGTEVPISTHAWVSSPAELLSNFDEISRIHSSAEWSGSLGTAGIKQPKTDPHVHVGGFTLGLRGGLGNKLFAVAAALAIGKDANAAVSVERIHGWGHNIATGSDHEHSHADEDALNFFDAYPQVPFWNLDEPPRITSTHRQLAVSNHEPVEIHESTALVGYFINSSYFAHHRELVVAAFEPAALVKQEVMRHPLTETLGASIGVHVRMTDHEKLGWNCDEYYFAKAIRAFNDDQPVIFFSDDIQFCRDVVAVRDEFSSRELYFAEGNRNVVDLELMRRCQHHVIAASTFGWWGAYLAHNYPHNRVVRPNGYANLGPHHWEPAPTS